MINPKIIYQNKFKKFGVNHKALQWKEKGAAHQRFRQFWAEIDFTNRNVLDVGCGFGEMGNFLTKRYNNVNYTGVDITPEFIENGKILYPQLNLLTLDYFDQPLPELYDTVISSGTLNSNFGNKSENMEFRQKAIKTMFEHTTDILTFNMLGGHPIPINKKESNIWYADSLKILEYCLSLTRRVILRANYHPKDFTVFMYHTKK